MNLTCRHLCNALLVIITATPLQAAASDSYFELQQRVESDSNLNWLLFACGILMIFILLWNRKLSHQLARHTAELQHHKQYISAHKVTELALEESREQLAIAFEAANLGYWDWRPQSNELYSSEHFPIMLGYSAVDFPQTTDHWLSLVHPDDQASAMAVLQLFLEGDDSFLRSEYRILAANGTWRWIMDVGRVVERDAQGKAERMVGVYSDITERKQADLKSSLVRRVLEQSLNEIYLFDMETLHFVDVNLGARQNLGYSMSELMTMTPLDIKPEFSAESLSKRVEPLVSGAEDKIVFTTYHQRKDGSQYLAEVHLQLMWEESPLFVAIAIDITERQQQQQALMELSTQLQKIATKVPAMLYRFKLRPDGSSCFPYASAAMLKMFRTPPEEAEEDAANIFAVINSDDIDEVSASIAESARTLKPWRQEFRVRDEAGSMRWLFGHSVPNREPEPDGSIIWHGVVTDITEQKQTELDLQKSQRQYQHLVDDIGDKFLIFSHTGGVLTYLSDGAQDFFGLAKGEMIGKPWGEQVNFLLEDEMTERTISAQMADGSLDFVQFNMRYIHPDGGERTLHISTHPTRDELGNLLSIEGLAEDITEQKIVQDQQRLAASVFEHSQQSIIITDADNRIIDVNPACLKLTGYTREALLGKNPSIFKSGSQKAEFYIDMWQSLERHGYWQGEIWNRKQSGELFAERLTINTVRNEKGVLQHYVAVASDITYLKEHQANLERLAFKDSLTGLPNRRLLDDRMHQALIQAKRHEKLIAVCYLDLDGFKPINDSYGHKAGDQVLIETALRLEKAVREGDTVIRMGGDEFVLLILDLQTIVELKEVMDRVLSSLTQPFFLTDSGSATLSASIGITLYPIDKSEANTLLRHADQAMYTAKRQGKNHYRFFDPEEEQRVTADQLIQHEIELALSEQQLRLFYQPMVNMRTGKVAGLEALVRWQHPLKGLLAPGSFLPAIEQTPFIVALGGWVLRQVMLQMRAWRELGINLKVSVNIATQQLEQSDFVESLRALINEFSDVPASQLELEILETAAMYDIGYVSRIMAECSTLGVNFALDDFGTGYSSLTYLKSLPAKVIKIDQSFVCGLLNNHQDIDIIHGILDLAKAFNRTPVAEGVETIQHGILLLNLGCELAQGYGIAQPMPAEDVPDWLRDFRVPSEWLDSKSSDPSNQEYSLLLMAAEQHRQVSRVLYAIEQQMVSLLPKQITDPQSCEFGRWLANEGELFYGKLDEFSYLRAKYHELHELYGQVIEYFKEDDYQALYRAADQLQELRTQLLEGLHQLHAELRSPLLRGVARE
ncbi:MAG: PAS domain S-box protein [Methyloprofundus sp.]|nr:PAS domain S-box protein [Methyloprofundus sp.]